MGVEFRQKKTPVHHPPTARFVRVAQGLYRDHDRRVSK